MADGKSSCDYGFHMSITDWNDEEKKEIKEMTRQGVTSYKLYMAYDNLKVNDKELFEILSAIEEEHGIAGVHCENGDIIKAVTEKLKAEERHSIRLHPKSRQPVADDCKTGRYTSEYRTFKFQTGIESSSESQKRRSAGICRDLSAVSDTG